jgi:hypothetical protein
MITSIPRGQICQAFDPMMFLPEKTLNIIGIGQNANPSCVAPAFVYIDGAHGKKFLCDFHYYYEVNMTRDSSYKTRADAWEDIQQYKIDEREKIKETFAKNVTTSLTLGKKCSLGAGTSCECDAEALVRISKKGSDPNIHGSFYCNFHFRKNYYRVYSNGLVYENIYDILDERYRMTFTINEESLNLKAI